MLYKYTAILYNLGSNDNENEPVHVWTDTLFPNFFNSRLAAPAIIQPAQIEG